MIPTIVFEFGQKFAYFDFLVVFGFDVFEVTLFVLIIHYSYMRALGIIAVSILMGLSLPFQATITHPEEYVNISKAHFISEISNIFIFKRIR